MATNTDLIQQLYVAYFNRPADVAGLNFWLNAMTAGATIDQISKSFNGAKEYTDAYAGKSAENIVDTVYMNLFGRHAEAGGLDFWGPKVQSGAISVADLVKVIAAGAVNADGTPNADGVAYANKVTAAEAFTTEINSAGNEAERLAYASGSADALAAAKAYIASVTDAASLATAIAGVHNAAQGLLPVVLPTTTTLTTGTDIVKGTAGADVIIADNTTMSAGDQINGGAGVDTLNYTHSAGAASLPASNISNVEVLNLRNVGSGTLSLDASTITGLTAINADRATANVTLTNVDGATAVGIIGNGTAVNAAVSVGYASTSSTATINVSGGVNDPAGAADLTISTANTKVVINSTGAANALDTVALGGGATSLTINATTDFGIDSVISGVAANAALTVTGAGAVVLGTLDNNFVTVDASTATGGLSTTLGTGITSFKGTTGADSVTTAATTAAGATIAGGAGTDTLVLAATNDVTTSAKGAQYTGFETLSSKQTSTFDASLIAGITTVQTAADGAGFSNLTAGQAASIAVKASQTGATAYSLKDATGSTDVLGLTVKGATAASVVNINAGTATIAGFETLNLAVNGGLNNVNFLADGTTAAAAGTDYDAFSFAASTALKNVKVTGAYGAAVSIAGQTKVVSFDASANTAGVKLTTGGQTGALVATATGAADIIVVGAVGTNGSQSIDAGAGNDKISGAQADIAAAVIKGGVGTDTLTLTDTGTVTIADNSFVNVTGIEKLVLGATTGLTWTVGGYANAIATANAGVLDITATSLASSAAVAIDGSGLGGSNSLKLSLKDTAGTGNITITESAGADSIKVVTATSAGGSITIGGGTAALASTAVKTIDASGVAFSTGGLTITTGAGADIIKVGDAGGTVTAGKGADVVTLLAAHASATNLVYAAGDSTQTSMDLVSNFNVAGTVADKLTFTGGTTTNLTSGQLGASGWTVSSGVATKTGATLADFLAAATTASAAGVVAFDDGTNTYVVSSEGTSATTDSVVELVGVTGVTALGTGAAANHKIIVA